VNATQITGTLAYTQIGSINAATITIGQLADSQIASVSGAKLTIGTVDSTKFVGFSIDVGGGANLPGRIRVLNNGTTVAQMGILTEVGTSNYGGWFQLFGAGGTSYANAHIFSDASGNLSIRDASISINGQITTSTSTFDSSYGSLALINAQSPDSTSFISRGLVFYYNGGKIGSLVRSPGGGWLALECAVGGAYILIDGNQGIRSDAGYLVGSNRVINSAGQFTGGVSTSASISTSSSITGGSLSAGGGSIGGGSLNVGSGNISCGTLSISGSGGQAVICPSSMISAQGFGIYGVANGVGMDVNVGGTTLHFRGGLFTGIN
jgi:hypothetical protein